MRPVAPLLLTVVLLTGCSEARNAVSTVSDCAALARDVASTGLSGVPTREEAETALQRLDDRVDGLADTRVRDAAADLRDRLRELAEATRSADPVAAQEAAERARDAATSTAEACGLPAEQFLG
jgi:hypothetical protein